MISDENRAKLEKLPKWAQEEFKSLERERDDAINSLKKWTDEQTTSPISVSELVCDGEQRGPGHYTRYIQSNHIEINFQDVYLRILLRDGDRGRGGIELQWSGREAMLEEMALIPTGFQSATLVNPKNIVTCSK